MERSKGYEVQKYFVVSCAFSTLLSVTYRRVGAYPGRDVLELLPLRRRQRNGEHQKLYRVPVACLVCITFEEK